MYSKLLPIPYDTECIEYEPMGFKNANDCMAKCLTTKSMVAFNKMPFSVILNDTLQNDGQKEVSVNDLMNQTVSRTYVEIEHECVNQCNNPDCEFDISMTTVNYDQFEGDSIKFEIGVPKEPLFNLRYYAATSLEEFILYSSSIVSIWFGFSIMSFNPFGVAKRKVMKVKDDNVKLKQQLNLNNEIYRFPNQTLKQVCIGTRELLRNQVAVHNYTIAKMLFKAKQYRSMS